MDESGWNHRDDDDGESDDVIRVLLTCQLGAETCRYARQGDDDDGDDDCRSQLCVKITRDQAYRLR